MYCLVLKGVCSFFFMIASRLFWYSFRLGSIAPRQVEYITKPQVLQGIQQNRQCSIRESFSIMI